MGKMRKMGEVKGAETGDSKTMGRPEWGTPRLRMDDKYSQ
jgi:hypothetical protein